MGEILDMVTADNLVHGRDREGPGTGAGAVEYFYIRERGNVETDSGLLAFAIEFWLYSPGDLYLSVQQAFERILVVAVQIGLDVTALHNH